MKTNRFNGFQPAHTIAEDAMGGVYYQLGEFYYTRRANLTTQPGPFPIDSNINLGPHLSKEEILKAVRRIHDPELI